MNELDAVIELIFEEVLFELRDVPEDDEAAVWLALREVKERHTPWKDDPPAYLATPSEFRAKTRAIRERLARG